MERCSTPPVQLITTPMGLAVVEQPLLAGWSLVTLVARHHPKQGPRIKINVVKGGGGESTNNTFDTAVCARQDPAVPFETIFGRLSWLLEVTGSFPADC